MYTFTIANTKKSPVNVRYMLLVSKRASINLSRFVASIYSDFGAYEIRFTFLKPRSMISEPTLLTTRPQK